MRAVAWGTALRVEVARQLGIRPLVGKRSEVERLDRERDRSFGQFLYEASVRARRNELVERPKILLERLHLGGRYRGAQLMESLQDEAREFTIFAVFRVVDDEPVFDCAFIVATDVLKKKDQLLRLGRIGGARRRGTPRVGGGRA